MAVKGQGEEAGQFARALGLDPRKTRSITLKIHCDDLIIVEVEMMPDKKDLENLGWELKRFNLIESDES